MMHRQGHHVMGPCTCGMVHGQTTTSFSMLLSMPNHKSYGGGGGDCDMYSYAATSPPSSSVDCTLSLGTPSTRVSQDEEKRHRQDRRSVSNFCWDLLQSKHTPDSHTKSARNTGNSNNDPLLARRCANCDTTSTPLWRNGPRGPKSLCNACGIRFKKEERRAGAVAATTAANSGGIMESGQMFSGHQNAPWSYTQSHQSQKMTGNELRFVDHDAADGNGGNAVPFLSWRLNVTDKPSLVHNFTR